MMTTSTQNAVRNPTGPFTNTGSHSTVRLTGPVKVVQVPVAGQPGRFVTGILPVAPNEQSRLTDKKKGRNLTQIIATLVAVVILLGGGVGFWVYHNHGRLPLSLGSTASSTTSNSMLGTPGAISNSNSTAANPATATAAANIILSDPLSEDTHNWPVTPTDVYAFQGGAYHITNKNNVGQVTVLPSSALNSNLAYSLTMDQVSGDTATNLDSFGIIMRFNQYKKAGQLKVGFYSFEVQNTKGGTYNFWKYDAGNKGWTQLWQDNIGNEYHLGLKTDNVNTLKVVMNGSKFTLSVNGKVVKELTDTTFSAGTVGMIVNQNNTEIAFKDMYLTRN
jgi:hypothetical protein